MTTLVWPCHLFGPSSRSQETDLNLSQSCPRYNRKLKFFLRIYTNIKPDTSESPVSHLWVCSKYLFQLILQILLSEFYSWFKGVCRLLFIGEDFLPIHLSTTTHACGFGIESKITTLPFILSLKSQVYQSLLPQGLNVISITQNKA